MDYTMGEHNKKLKKILNIWLLDYYKKLKVSEKEAMNEIKTKFNNLRQSEASVYKMLVGMMYSDTVLLLAHDLNYDCPSEKTLNDWNNLIEVADITDLIEQIDLGFISLECLIEGYISFQNEDTFNQFLGFESTNIKHLLKFNPYLISNYLELIKMYSINEAIDDYVVILNEDMDYEEYDDVSKIDRVIKKLKDKLLILSLTDNEEFQRTMVEIIYEYYGITKVEEKDASLELTTLDRLLISTIEEKEVDEIIEELLRSDILLAYVINKYLNYKAMGYEVEPNNNINMFQTTMNKIKKYHLK